MNINMKQYTLSLNTIDVLSILAEHFNIDIDQIDIFDEQTKEFPYDLKIIINSNYPIK